MDENNGQRIPLPLLLAVTALSFLLFNLLIKIMEGAYSPLLFRIALISGILSFIAWAGSLLPARQRKKDAV